MTEMILLKLGELVLKGANRHTLRTSSSPTSPGGCARWASSGVHPPVHHLCGAPQRHLRHGRGLRGHEARVRCGGDLPGQSL
ncbi:MAG: hypothetical protein ACLSAF_06285 [Intestinimonas sp.]